MPDELLDPYGNPLPSIEEWDAAPKKEEREPVVEKAYVSLEEKRAQLEDYEAKLKAERECAAHLDPPVPPNASPAVLSGANSVTLTPDLPLPPRKRTAAEKEAEQAEREAAGEVDEPEIAELNEETDEDEVEEPEIEEVGEEAAEEPPRPETPPPETWQEMKAAGNKAFKQWDFEQAIHWYTEASTDDTCFEKDFAILMSNRAMARLKLAEDLEDEEKEEALEMALEDAQMAAAADPDNAKAHFREATSLLQLGRDAEAVPALQKCFMLLSNKDGPDKETHTLLLQLDERYKVFNDSYARVETAMEKKRADLAAMVSRGHPMSMRTGYYATWMKKWEPGDREVLFALTLTLTPTLI